MRFRPITFDWKEEYCGEDPALHQTNYGFISQEVEAVVPSMVTMVEEHIGDQTITDFKLLNLDALFPLLVRALQEQQETIQSQQVLLETLKAENVSQKAEAESLKTANISQKTEMQVMSTDLIEIKKYLELEVNK